mmetsp:Transcript_9875/g.26799  ORF Transcript_9875/g.26799 Transcript_9875/m.26799 type:complete len:214 (+) Transcript_9875:2866-3507(+)
MRNPCTILLLYDSPLQSPHVVQRSPAGAEVMQQHGGCQEPIVVLLKLPSEAVVHINVACSEGLWHFVLILIDQARPKAEHSQIRRVRVQVGLVHRCFALWGDHQQASNAVSVQAIVEVHALLLAHLPRRLHKIWQLVFAALVLQHSARPTSDRSQLARGVQHVVQDTSKVNIGGRGLLLVVNLSQWPSVLHLLLLAFSRATFSCSSCSPAALP